MALSILHRATGVALSVGTLLLTWWLVAAAVGPAAFATVQQVLHSFIGQLALFGWTFALFYHMAAGIRHLVWDAGYAFDLPSAEKGAYITVAAAAGLTVFTWIVALAA
jgi:succinate dehydrogenase / fumarate reductase cytochrome b subunit